jgi:hypothetical protein
MEEVYPARVPDQAYRSPYGLGRRSSATSGPLAASPAVEPMALNPWLRFNSAFRLSKTKSKTKSTTRVLLQGVLVLPGQAIPSRSAP